MDDLQPLRSSERDPLARLLEHGAGFEVDYDVEAALARHLQLVQNVPVTTPLAATRRAWWAVGGGVVVAGLTAAWISASAPVTASPVVGVPTSVAAAPAIVPPATAALPAIETARPDLALAEAPVEEVNLVIEDRPAPKPRRVVAQSQARREVAPIVEGSANNAGADDSVVREAANVKEARRRLAAGDFAGAIAACDRGDGEFPSGMLAVERDGLRVLARLRRDADAAARDRASAYLSVHPSGPVSVQIRDAL